MDWQRKVSWRGDRTWVHGKIGLHDVRTDLKSREVLLPITRFPLAQMQRIILRDTPVLLLLLLLPIFYGFRQQGELSLIEGVSRK